MSSKAVSIAAPIAVPAVSSRPSVQWEIGPVALFAGIGVLVLFLAALTGVQGVWY